MEQYKFGEVVGWTAKVEDGPSIKREGVIVAIVPPEADPLNFIPKGYTTSTIDNTHKKDHESYIIVSGARIYWPPVGKLKRIGN